MKRKAAFAAALKALCFLLLLALLLNAVTELVLPKDYALTSLWPATSNAEGLYRLKRNTLDVLILGSSKAYTAFIPQELYDGWGIRAYDLGTDLQSGLISWYWLKEALRFQKPAAVVLEIHDFFPVYDYLPLNAPEAMIRKAIDPMRWSTVKAEAVLDICRRDSEHSLLSYAFPHIRFHERWKDLGEDDFTLPVLRRHNELMGFSALPHESGITDYRPYRVGAETEAADFVPLMEEYLERIAALCREKGILLVLTCVPDTRATPERSACAAAFAERHGLPWLDYNEESLYASVGYDFAADNADFEHPALSGAIRLTAALGSFLRERLALPAREDAQWEEGRAVYEARKADMSLVRETDPAAYSRCLNEPRYTVFAAAGTGAARVLPPEAFAAWTDGPLGEALSAGQPFAAVIEGGETVRLKTEAGELRGSFRDGKSRFRLTAGEEREILLDGEAFSVPGDGISLVVYDTQRRMVLDRVCLGAELRHVN